MVLGGQIRAYQTGDVVLGFATATGLLMAVGLGVGGYYSQARKIDDVATRVAAVETVTNSLNDKTGKLENGLSAANTTINQAGGKIVLLEEPVDTYVRCTLGELKVLQGRQKAYDAAQEALKNLQDAAAKIPQPTSADKARADELERKLNGLK